MRIIAGSKRSLKLAGPPGSVSRPIIDRVKESLFSVLYGYDMPEDKVVADIFSGAGSLGLEALSRGAAFVLFVEQDAAVFQTLRKNIQTCGFEDRCKVLRTNAFSTGAPVENRSYDLVFVDPPYVETEDISAQSPLSRLFAILEDQVTKHALVVVRTHKRIQPLDRYGNFGVDQRRHWGTMNITFFKRTDG